MRAASSESSIRFVANCLPLIAIAFFGLFIAAAAAQQKKAPPLAGPDDRYKTDLLVVVAHPDDESGDIAGYLARVIYDQHKRVAAVFVNRGQHGNNQAGPEEGNALGAEREIEGRGALASLGVTKYLVPGRSQCFHTERDQRTGAVGAWFGA